MSLVQIPNLTPAIALNGTEQIEAVQAGTSVRVTSAQIALLASPYAGNPLLPALGGTGTGTIFTTGSIVFSGASGIYQQNNSKFFWDNTNFRLGVGTATPAYNLDVSGTASVSSSLTIGVQQTTQGSLVLANTAAGAFPTTVRSSNSASAAWTLTLPVSAGTNGYILTTNGSGVSSWTDPTALGIDVNIGTTVISGGSSGRVLYNNAGVFGEYSVVPLSVGGTNANLTASNGGIFYSTATAGAILSGTATANRVLLSGSSSAPAWSTATYPATTTINQILYSSAANTVSGLATANGGLLNTSATGVPSITATPTLGVAGTSAGRLLLSGATSGVVTLQTAAAAGTWSLTLPTTGGTNNYALTTNGSGVTSWSQISLTAGVTGVLPVANGGTNASAAGITAFNNITGYTAAGATGTTSTNLVFSTSPTVSYLSLAAGTATAGQSPLKFTSGTNLTAVEAGATEYNGSFLYFTPGTTSGRGFVPAVYDFRLTANGSAIGPTIADFFGSTSSISLEATSVYDIEIYAYFTKTTAGTATWTLTCSSAPTLISGYYTACPITGIAAGAVTSGYAGSQGAATAAFAATGTLSTGVNHWFQFKVQIVTNAATNFRIQLTQSAGTATPLAGSYYSVVRISTSTGTFAA